MIKQGSNYANKVGGQIFSDLSYANNIQTYYGLPLNEIENVSKTMYDKYETNLNDKSKLDIYLNSINVLPQDEQYKNQQKDLINNTFNDIYGNDNWENASYLIQKMTNKLASDNGLNKAKQNYEIFNEFKKAQIARYEKGEITKEAAYKEINDAYNNYEGVQFDKGLQDYTGNINTIAPPNYININKELKEYFKDWESSEVLGLVTGKNGEKIINFEKVPGGYYINGKTELITDNEVQSAMKDYFLNQPNMKESFNYYTDLEGRNGNNATINDLKNLNLTDEELGKAGINKTLSELSQDEINNLYDNVFKQNKLNSILSTAAAPISFTKYDYELHEDKPYLKQLDFNYDMMKKRQDYTYDVNKLAIKHQYDLDLKDKELEQTQKTELIKSGILNPDGTPISNYKELGTTQYKKTSFNFPEIFDKPQTIAEITKKRNYNENFSYDEWGNISNKEYVNIHDWFNGKIKAPNSKGIESIPNSTVKQFYNDLLKNNKISLQDNNEIVMKKINDEYNVYLQSLDRKVIYNEYSQKRKDEQNLLIFGAKNEKGEIKNPGNISSSPIIVIDKHGMLIEYNMDDDTAKKLGYKNVEDLQKNSTVLGDMFSPSITKTQKGSFYTGEGVAIKLGEDSQFLGAYIPKDIISNKINEPLLDLISVGNSSVIRKTQVQVPALNPIYGNVFTSYESTNVITKNKQGEYENGIKIYGVYNNGEKVQINDGITPNLILPGDNQYLNINDLIKQ